MQEQNTQPVNPLLAKLRLPGTTFRLPSKGVFYDNGELSPDVKDGEVEVYPMTAIDEVLFSTPDKLLSGKAVIEVFAHCIPQVVKADELLSKDVDFLMVCLRHVSFGQFMEVGYTHNCENAQPHTYQVDLNAMINAAKAIDPTVVKDEFVMTVPNGQVVVLRPIQYRSVITLYQTTAITKTGDMTQDEAMKIIVNTLTDCIKSVDGITDKEMIYAWILGVPLGYKRLIETAAQRLSQWGVDFTTKMKCKDCGADIDITTTANPVSFFI